MNKHTIIFYINVIGTATVIAFALGLVLVILFKANEYIEEYRDTRDGDANATDSSIVIEVETN